MMEVRSCHRLIRHGPSTMFGGRILAKITRWGEPFLKPSSFQKSCQFSVNGSRALSIRKLPFEIIAPKPVPSKDTDINLIKKRFFRDRSNRSSSEGASFSSKIFAAFGVLLGICSGASAYHVLMNTRKENIFGSDYFVACEPEEKKTCKEQPCEEKTCADTVCLRDRTRECLEEKILRANADLELALVDTKIKAIDYTEAAIEAYCEAIVYMTNYLDVGYNVIDNDWLETEPCSYAKSWCCVYKSAKQRCAKVTDALQKGQVAWELLCRLREVIESGKACQYTAANPLLGPVHEALLCAERELLARRTQMEAVCSDHELVTKYQSGIGNFRKELEEDICAKYDEELCGEIKFVEQKIALMIEQAYIRLIQVHQQWAKDVSCKGWKRSTLPPPSIPNFGDDDATDKKCEEDDEDCKKNDKDSKEGGQHSKEGDEDGEEDDEDSEGDEEDCEEDDEDCKENKKEKDEDPPEPKGILVMPIPTDRPCPGPPTPAEEGEGDCICECGPEEVEECENEEEECEEGECDKEEEECEEGDCDKEEEECEE